MPTAFIVGTNHAFQRHQDHSQENEIARSAFEKFLKANIQERVVDAIAEEAGEDREVWRYLMEQDAVILEQWRGLFAGTEVVDAPQPTIARSLAAAEKITHADVRAADAENLTIEERDEAMACLTAKKFHDAKSVLIIVGEAHRVGVARILAGQFGWKTDSLEFR